MRLVRDTTRKPFLAGQRLLFRVDGGYIHTANPIDTYLTLLIKWFSSEGSSNRRDKFLFCRCETCC